MYLGDNEITELVIPETTNIIADKAFYNCSNITSIIIPITVKTIGKGSFSGTHISSIVLPESIEKIGSQAFMNCNLLESLNVPSSVTNLESQSFENGTNLRHITLPQQLETIGEGVGYHAFTRANRRRIGHSTIMSCRNDRFQPFFNLLVAGTTAHLHQLSVRPLQQEVVTH